MGKSKSRRNKRTKKRGVPKPRQENKRRNLLKACLSILSRVWAFLAAIPIVLAFVGYFSFRVSASPYTVMNASDPFSVPFTIENESLFAIYDIEIKCRVNSAIIQTNQFKNYEWSYGPNVTMLNPNEITSKTCRAISIVDVPVEEIEQLDITIKINFRPRFYPFRKNKEFRFKSQNINGMLYWLPEAKSN